MNGKGVPTLYCENSLGIFYFRFQKSAFQCILSDKGKKLFQPKGLETKVLGTKNKMKFDGFIVSLENFSVYNLHLYVNTL